MVTLPPYSTTYRSLETVIVNAEEKDDQFSEDGKLLKKFTDSFSNYPWEMDNR